ncbi:MAG: dienelactone hydrolase, partial [Dinoroseobacter sp.]
MSAARVIVLILALIVTGVGLSQLHGAQGAVEITSDRVGSTPVSVYRQSGMGAGPVVVIAHGFAGSRPLMKPYALTLAQAGYVAVSFDFLGHGRHPDPMSGDVETNENTTQLLMDQTAEVINYALGLDGVDGRVALLGHSMATDIIVRQAARDPRVGPVVAISMFSQAASEATPRQLLMITGEWEGVLRTEALRVLRLVAPSAEEGANATSASGEVVRRAVV